MTDAARPNIRGIWELEPLMILDGYLVLEGIVATRFDWIKVRKLDNGNWLCRKQEGHG